MQPFANQQEAGSGEFGLLPQSAFLVLHFPSQLPSTALEMLQSQCKPVDPACMSFIARNCLLSFAIGELNFASQWILER